MEEKEIGFYRGYALYCDTNGDFSAKKTGEAREYQDYDDLEGLKEDIKENVTNDTDFGMWIFLLLIFFVVGFAFGVLLVQSNTKITESAVGSLNSSLNNCLDKKQAYNCTEIKVYDSPTCFCPTCPNVPDLSFYNLTWEYMGKQNEN